MYYSQYSTNECIQLSYFFNQKIGFLPLVQEDPEPQNGRRVFPRILSLPSSTFPCVSVTCHCQGQGTGLDNLWSDPGSLLFLYAQVIIEGFIRVHKCKCGNFERDWRRTYQRLHSYTFSAKSRVFKGLVSSRGSCLQEFRVNKFLSLRLLLLKIR